MKMNIKQTVLSNINQNKSGKKAKSIIAKEFEQRPVISLLYTPVRKASRDWGSSNKKSGINSARRSVKLELSPNKEEAKSSRKKLKGAISSNVDMQKTKIANHRIKASMPLKVQVQKKPFVYQNPWDLASTKEKKQNWKLISSKSPSYKMPVVKTITPLKSSPIVLNMPQSLSSGLNSSTSIQCKNLSSWFQNSNQLVSIHELTSEEATSIVSNHNLMYFTLSDKLVWILFYE